jgi:nucleoside phosphorylase
VSRIIRSLLAVALLGGLAVVPSAHADETCRLLVLGAMPVEIGPFLARATIDNRVDVSTTNEHGQQQLKSFFFGTLEGNDVIMAMTGIGTLNAIETADIAFTRFGCISGVVFSGVSGGTGDEYIGDVLVPESWTLDLFDADGNKTSSSYTANDAMLQAANFAATTVSLSSNGRIGDVGCVGIDPEKTPTIHFDHVPTITIGAGVSGRSSDPFGGHALPCVPGTDTFGCNPCKFQQVSSGDVARTVTTAKPFATPKFFSWFQTWSASGTGTFDVEDMESAAVASVADGKAPFIAFRSPSDGGKGDPLPPVPGPLGFLPQFLLYRQYAADNAAAVALAFLREWKAEQL